MDQEEESKRLAVLRDWYESYSKTVSFVATIAASLLIISATYVLKDTLTDSKLRNALKPVFVFLAPSWLFLLAAAVLGGLGRVANYKWYSAGLSAYMNEAFSPYKWDNFSYTEPRLMRRWGRLSAVFGRFAGYSLCLGVIFFLAALVQALVRLFSAA